jgi:beta-1,4-mannosyl-glycoprotein beta-1,4-N-acetylglucosaminyltransferase
MGLNGVPDDALVMLSDVDEIPRASTVTAAAGIVADGFQVGFEMRHSLYHVNNVCYTMAWRGTQLTTARHMRRVTPQSVRDRRNYPAYLVHDAGWHFTGMGGAERLGEKIRSFSHTEVDTPEINNPAHLAACIEAGVDVSGRTDIRFKREALNVTYPRYLLDHQDKFSHLIWRSQNDG